ncbi:MAG: hypothetical protein JXA60_00465 [Candidatus Coatesbacteria bacterium]|nr:hypothetical protein [Candidatus Coatesbacteria bacterium]
MQQDRLKIFYQILYFLIVLGFIIWSSYFIYFTSIKTFDGSRYFCLFDDAMISMRYACNLVDSNGLVFNKGEFVEGYTNLLMILFMAVPQLFLSKSNSALFIQISGIFFCLLIAIFGRKIARQVINIKEPFLVLVFLASLLYYPLNFWSLMGMETGLLTFLLYFGISRAIQTKNQNKLDYGLIIIFVLALFTRIDIIISISMILLYRMVTNQHKAIFYKELALVILILFYRFTFSKIYYGEWLPNTYYLKMYGFTLFSRIENGLLFIKPFVKSIVVLLFAAILSLIIKYTREKLLLLSVFFSGLLYQIYIGGDAWFYWRFLAPFVPLLFILIFSLLNDITQENEFKRISDFFMRQRYRIMRNTKTYIIVFLLLLILTIVMSIYKNMLNYWKAYGYIVSVSVLLIISLFFNFSGKKILNLIRLCLIISVFLFYSIYMPNSNFLKEIIFKSYIFCLVEQTAKLNKAIVLKEITTEKATIGIIWLGAISYYSERYAIDYLGKIDKRIAHLKPDLTSRTSWAGVKTKPGHNKYDLNYSLKERKPTFTTIKKLGDADLTQWVSENYEEVYYKGVSLVLRKDAKEVVWEKIHAENSRNPGKKQSNIIESRDKRIQSKTDKGIQNNP